MLHEVDYARTQGYKWEAATQGEQNYAYEITIGTTQSYTAMLA